MSLRLDPLRRPVEILHDGDLLTAEWDEPLSHTLIASERLVLARSPKLHRPRGPYCLRAACDGCLVRVDGVPNVMACQHRVRGAETVETQNVLGSREVDLLEATDFLFPEGFDHHRLFAGVRGVSKVVALLARRIAGLGRLPENAAAVRAATSLDCDVLIVGGGRSGLARACSVGARAVLIDDGAELGGALALLAPERAVELVTSARAAGVTIEERTTALGLYPAEDGGPPTVLLVNEAGIAVARPGHVILATGAHDRPPPFVGNDLPGIFSARAGLSLLRAGVAPGRRIVVLGEGPFARVAAELAGERVIAHLADPSAVIAAEGGQQLRQVRFTDSGGEIRSLATDALLFDSVLTPAFELAVQAGATTRFEPGLGYVPRVNADGEAAPHTTVIGRAAGAR